MKLFDNQSVVGTSAEFVHRANGNIDNFLIVSGTGTVSLEVSPDGGTTWVALENASQISTGTTQVKIPSGKIRAQLTGIPSALSAWLV